VLSLFLLKVNSLYIILSLVILSLVNTEVLVRTNLVVKMFSSHPCFTLSRHFMNSRREGHSCTSHLIMFRSLRA
jgi:hypothetical protein